MIALDTSVVVRYLVQSPAEPARRAGELLDAGGEIGISVVVLLETAHVLRTKYAVPRTDVASVLIELLMRRNVRLIGLSVDDAIDAFVRARALPGTPIADALVVAMAKSAGARPLYTFDLGLARHGIEIAVP